jgi:hypothetical protein
MQRNDVARSYLLKLFFSDNPLRVNGKDGISFDIFALPTKKLDCILTLYSYILLCLRFK